MSSLEVPYAFYSRALIGHRTFPTESLTPMHDGILLAICRQSLIIASTCTHQYNTAVKVGKKVGTPRAGSRNFVKEGFCHGAATISANHTLPYSANFSRPQFFADSHPRIYSRINWRSMRNNYCWGVWFNSWKNFLRIGPKPRKPRNLRASKF